MLRRLSILSVLLAVILTPTALAANVSVRVEGKTTTIFGAAQPRLAADNALQALDMASTAGEFYYGTTTADFGTYVSQIGKYANVWHGRDHLKADTSDGYMYTAPVGSFKPNPLGLYDVYGNVFEFCTGHLRGDKPTTSHARGGSWWCSKNACCFFNSADIGKQDHRASFSNQGFRVVKD